MTVFGINVVFQKHQKTMNFPYQILDAYPWEFRGSLLSWQGMMHSRSKLIWWSPTLSRIWQPKRNLQLRTHTGRRISENQFGILANRWRIYHTVMLFESVAVESLILATLALYSMLIKNSAKYIYCPTGLWNTKDVNQDLTLGLRRNNNCADSVFLKKNQ